MAIPVQPTRRPLVGRKRSTGSAPAVSGPAVMPRFCPGPVDSPHSHGRTYDLPVTTVGELSVEFGRRASPALAEATSSNVRPAPLPARPARCGPGRRRGPRRRARHPVDQDHRQGVRHRPGDPDGRPHHARGPGHPRQGPRAGVQGDAPRPRRPDLPAGRRGLRLPRHGRGGQGDPGRQRRHVASVATAFPSGRAALDIKLADTQDAVEAGADEIDMVIDRARSSPAATSRCSTRSSRSARRAATRT